MRKISANYIYSAQTGFMKNAILTLNDDEKVVELKENKHPNREEAGTEFYNGIICPGFINAHCHLELSHMQNQIPEGQGLDNFIFSVVTSRKSDKVEIDRAIEKADEEMRREGVVAVGDISNKEDSFKVKSQSSIFYHSFLEIFNMVNSEADETFNNGMKLLNKAKNDYKISASLVPHAPYSVSEKLFELFRINQNSQENRLSVHSQETKFENEFIHDGKGRFHELFTKLGMEKGDSKPRKMNSLKYLSLSIPEKAPLLLVHNVYTTKQDIEEGEIDLKKTWFCLCPNSNHYISRKNPGIFLINNYPDKVCLGTDSLASNHRLSILEEMKTLQFEHGEIPLNLLLQFATLNGSKALNLENRLGSFEKGKKPGVVLIESVDLQNLMLKRDSCVRVLL